MKSKNKSSNTASKHIRWDTSAEKDKENIPTKKTLQHALKNADLEKLNYILNNIPLEIAAEVLNSSRGDWMKLLFQMLNRRTQNNLIYDNKIFQEILEKFMEINFNLTKIAFGGMRIYFKSGKEAGYSDIETSLINDYEIAKSKYANDHLTKGTSTETNNHAVSTGENIAQDGATAQCSSLSPGAAGASQHNSLPEEISKDIYYASKKEVSSEATTNSLPTLAFIEELYSRLSQLPEWLQAIIINSAPIHAIIESTQELLKLYDLSKATQSFSKDVEQNNYSTQDVYDLKADRVSYQELTDDNLIDMTNILDSFSSELLGVLPTSSIDNINLLSGANQIYDVFHMGFNHIEIM